MMNPADRVVRFISNLTLTDDYDGRPFVLRDWQEHRIIRPAFGTLRPDGRRQYRRVFLFLPRKQAKTQLCASIGLYGLKGTGKGGENIACAALGVRQASNLFNKAKTIVERDPWLRKTTRIYRSTKILECRKTGNVMKVLTGEGPSQHGDNFSIVLLDELHTQPNRELYDALTSGFQSRSEPLLFLPTTAGNDLNSLCHEEYEYAKRVAANPSIDPTYLPIIYEADPQDDIYDERTWFKAMPALGNLDDGKSFCDIEFIRSEFAKAKHTPSEEAKCRQYYLNLWTPKAIKWLPVAKWNECGKNEVSEDEFFGVPVYGGGDLSSVSDVTAFAFVTIDEGGNYRCMFRFWIPEDTADKIDRTKGTSYRTWSRRGFITLTSGDTIDHDLIISEIIEYCDSHDVREIRLDPHSAAQVAIKLSKNFINVKFMQQGTLSMNEPVSYMEALLSKGRLHHGNNPILNMMAANTVRTVGGHGNVKFDKDISDGKIDGMVALAMSVGAAMMSGDVEGGIGAV